MQTPPNKRIVSKGEYVLSVGDKALSRLVGIGFYGLSLLCALFACWCVFLIVSGRFLADDMTTNNAVSVPLLAILAPLTYFLHRSGHNAFARAYAIQQVIPLTRANTADLPAPDSLVRASQEPVQAQQTVLLRAVVEGQETPTEQLVRPAARGDLMAQSVTGGSIVQMVEEADQVQCDNQRSAR